MFYRHIIGGKKVSENIASLYNIMSTYVGMNNL